MAKYIAVNDAIPNDMRLAKPAEVYAIERGEKPGAFQVRWAVQQKGNKSMWRWVVPKGTSK